MNSKEKLAQVLHAAGLFAMEKKARAGEYADFESKSATPIIDLVLDLKRANRTDIARRAMNGEFDATKEEADEYAKRIGL